MGTCQTVPNSDRGRNHSVDNHEEGSKFSNTPRASQSQKQKGVTSKLKSKTNLLYCPNSHQITMMCTNRNCQSPALFCTDPRCSSGLPSHKSCSNIKIEEVVHLIHLRTKHHDKMLHKMHQTETILINQVIANRRKHFDEIFMRMKDNRFAQIVNKVYYNRQEHMEIKGAQTCQFVQRLKQSNSKVEDIQNDCLEEYQNEIKELAKELVKVQKIVLIDYAERCRIQIGKKKSESSCELTRASPLSFDSKIVHDQQQLLFIEDALGHPKHVNLLFRASEHEFKAAAFHGACDNITDTLTLIRTEFDKTIVGYTPLTWNSAHGFSRDNTGTSFLIALELKQRMKLIRPQKAIQCIPTYGPAFGGGCDIAICDSCNVRNDSCTNFAYSYNYQDQYQYGQQAWKALCGAQKSKYFKVKEYEIFKVEW